MYNIDIESKEQLLLFIKRECTDKIFEYLNGITSIGEYSFYDCDNLINITIPETVKNIGKYAFSLCSNLSTVTLKIFSPPELENSNAFPSNVSIIYIPKGSLSNYQSAAQWSNLSSKFVELQ